MSKKSVFFTSWREYEIQSDKLMTRARMSKLMRAWRRASIQGRACFKLEKIGTHKYRVEAVGYVGEWHYVQWENK